MSGFKGARWSFDYAASVLGDWLRSEGFPAESIGCPDINGKAEPMPFAIFAFVEMVSEDVAAKAKKKLNMTKLLGHTMLVEYRLEDHPIADPAAARQVCRKVKPDIQDSWACMLASIVDALTTVAAATADTHMLIAC